MNNKKIMDIATTYIIPALLAVLLTVYSAIMTDKFQKQTGANQKAIKAIADDISKVVDEINIKNDKIESNTNENIDISRQLSEILRKVNDLTIKTNLIASDIKNEQKVKGNLSLRLPKRELYQIDAGGGNQYYYAREILLNEDGFQALNALDPNIPILNLKLKNDELLISTTLYDYSGNVVTEINENKWAVGSNIFSKNWNENALEIIDNSGNVALQVSLKNDKIIIRGIIPTTVCIMVLTDENYIKLKYSDEELSSKLYYYSKKIKRIFEHTGSDYLGSKAPLTKEEKEKLDKEIQASKILKNKVKELKKLNTKSLIIEVSKHVKSLRRLLFEYELNQDRISYSENEDDFSYTASRDLQIKKRQELSTKLLSDYAEMYKIESIAINDVLKTKVPISIYKDFKEIMIDYEGPNNPHSLNLIVDDIEIMSKLISKNFNFNNLSNAKIKIQKLIDDLDLIIESQEKKQNILRDKYHEITRKKKSDSDFAKINEQQILESRLLELQYKLEYNLNCKIDAIIFKRELMKIVPNYRAKTSNGEDYYKNPSFYDTIKIKNDLEDMLKLIN